MNAIKVTPSSEAVRALRGIPPGAILLDMSPVRGAHVEGARPALITERRDPDGWVAVCCRTLDEGEYGVLTDTLMAGTQRNAFKYYNVEYVYDPCVDRIKATAASEYSFELILPGGLDPSERVQAYEVVAVPRGPREALVLEDGPDVTVSAVDPDQDLASQYIWPSDPPQPSEPDGVPEGRLLLVVYRRPSGEWVGLTEYGSVRLSPPPAPAPAQGQGDDGSSR